MALTHHFLSQHFLYCCLTQEQKVQLENDLDNGVYRTAYLMQQNLFREKEGFRCSTCGKFYPLQQLWYRDEMMELKDVARLAGKPAKFKKAAVAFCGDHYYAQNKKMLWKFRIGEDGAATQTDEIPMMGGVWYTVLSRDERYIATETFGDTVAIMDAEAKQIIAKKRKCGMHGAFVFTQDNRLLYFSRDAIRCWDFLEEKEEIVWQVPADWQGPPKTARVVCNNVLYNSNENTHCFQFTTWQADYAVVIGHLTPERVVPLPRVPAFRQMAYSQEQHVYTLPTEDSILLLDEHGCIQETCMCPLLQETSDGGGMFCIAQMPPMGPQRAFLSPDGAWFLLDFATAIVLMKRADGTIHHCIYSCTGRPTAQMGFVDKSHFWYAWGDTTYIQAIPAAT